MGPRLQDRIVDLILERGLEPGESMPTEPALMDELGASRNSVREALRALHTLGIVDIRHGYGTFVGAAPMTAFTPGLLFQARQSLGKDASVLADLVEIRRILEVELIGKVVPVADEAFLAELDGLTAAMESGERDADERFHQALYRPVGNDFALQLIALFWTVYYRLEAELEPPRKAASEITHGHDEIVAALRTGDPAAARAAMTEHFADIENRVASLTGRIAKKE
ncbi:FadR family transcriptional regulator [Allokutzneria sp. A3M-2-11 16]|uniref:FadR/GntR family transcriptional regulator n=1 Tax=Allokutzneria sp. A3M-2-11 16 TaxID=2962043 RepID=UPI0020B8362A|nr:FadR/GntR family transcriptional regulator [Allokutzneria sp. A3M-2-11 16]MCP3801413.1 FadR family transcriptional regulator [Allokutzneria sp. A3M-2-11 16]